MLYQYIQELKLTIKEFEKEFYNILLSSLATFIIAFLIDITSSYLPLQQNYLPYIPSLLTAILLALATTLSSLALALYFYYRYHKEYIKYISAPLFLSNSISSLALLLKSKLLLILYTDPLISTITIPTTILLIQHALNPDQYNKLTRLIPLPKINSEKDFIEVAFFSFLTILTKLLTIYLVY